MNRRHFCISAMSLLPMLHTGMASASQLSGKPISLVVPFAPGGNLDTVARIISPVLSEALDVNVLVENRPGAGGIIGASHVARSSPDGHTLLVTTPNTITVAPLMASASYALDDFTAVGQIARAALVAVVPPQSRFKTMDELLSQARRQPAAITVGHAGLGTTNHLAILALEDEAQCKFTSVAYKGSAPALTDLMGQQIDMVIDQLTSSLSFISSGKLKALTVLTAQRDPMLPDIPTISETVLPGFAAQTETGLLAPAKTPPAVIAQLNEALVDVLGTAKVRQQLQAVGGTAAPTPPDFFQKILLNQAKKAQSLHAQGKLTEI